MPLKGVKTACGEVQTCRQLLGECVRLGTALEVWTHLLFHRIVEGLGLEGTLKISCCGQGYFPLELVGP